MGVSTYFWAQKNYANKSSDTTKTAVHRFDFNPGFLFHNVNMSKYIKKNKIQQIRYQSGKVQANIHLLIPDRYSPPPAIYCVKEGFNWLAFL